MDLRRRILVIRGWLPLIVVCVALAAVTAYMVSGVLPKSYEARSTLIVGQTLSSTNPDYDQLLVSQRLSATYASLATKRLVLDAVIEQLGLAGSAADLAKRVDATAALDSTLLTITAEDPDPVRAAAIANAVAETLITVSPAIEGRRSERDASIDTQLAETAAEMERVQARVDSLGGVADRTARQEAELLALENRLVSLRSTYATLLAVATGTAANLLSVVDPAVPPLEPVFPRPLLNTILAAVLGLAVAIGIALLAEHLDDSIKDRDDAMEAVGLVTLGTVARMRGGRGRSEIYRLATVLHPQSSVAEAYRTLRANIEFGAVDAPIRSLLVTSSVPGEGKTVTAANLAVVFAQAGRRVLLVDGDLRRPGVHAIFGLTNAGGLTTLLRQEGASVDALAHPTEVAGLHVLTTGPLPPNPAELLGSRRMRTALEQFHATADLVIVDSPPLQAVTDAAILGSVVDATLLVIAAGHSRRGATQQATAALARAGARVLGVVLNRAPGRQAGSVDYYGERTTPPEAAAVSHGPGAVAH